VEKEIGVVTLAVVDALVGLSLVGLVVLVPRIVIGRKYFIIIPHY
jgi:hypothetical protein